MKWSDLPRNPSPKMLRQFAGAWLVFFLGWAAQQGFVRGHRQAALALAALALLVGVLGLLRPAAVRGIFVGWMILAFPIGWAVSQVTLLIMFYLILTPVALIFRLLGRDPLRRRLATGEASYWTSKETPSDLRRYLRQY